MAEKKSEEVLDIPDTSKVERPGKVSLTEEEWKAKLTKEEYEVTRNQGTEDAWSGDLLDKTESGLYQCSSCGVDLFSSSTKYDSGSGWPSFYQVLKDKDVPDLPVVDTRLDTRLGRRRTEVMCGKCDAHLGHVFNDGPQPSGHRYCINSVCLKFKPEKDTNKSGQ